MDFQPKTEQEIRGAMVLTPGVYDFEIVKAEEKTSKKGNAMIELTLSVFPGDDSKPRQIRDWLVSSMELKLNRFCRATGLEEAYQDGLLTAFACEGVSGKVKLTIEPNADYGDRNAVKDYVVSTTQPDDAMLTAREAEDEAAPEPKVETANFEQQLAATDDGIPF